MEFNSPSCDVCHRIKGEANKWLAAYGEDDLVVILPWARRPKPACHFCSRACLLKWLEPHLERMQQG